MRDMRILPFLRNLVGTKLKNKLIQPIKSCEWNLPAWFTNRSLLNRNFSSLPTFLHWDHIRGHGFFPDFYALGGELTR